jgi:hypothetical protein
MTTTSPRYERVYQNSRTRIDDMPVRGRPGLTYPRQTKEIRCCGEWLSCERFTTTCCHCAADYGMSGARLAPREQWGEETGEHWTECI